VSGEEGAVYCGVLMGFVDIFQLLVAIGQQYGHLTAI
jgi:hypothetical protein